MKVLSGDSKSGGWGFESLLACQGKQWVSWMTASPFSFLCVPCARKQVEGPFPLHDPHTPAGLFTGTPNKIQQASECVTGSDLTGCRTRIPLSLPIFQSPPACDAVDLKGIENLSGFFTITDMLLNPDPYCVCWELVRKCTGGTVIFPYILPM